MKRAIARFLGLLLIIHLFPSIGYADQNQDNSNELVITQESVSSIYEITYMDMHPELNLTVQRVDDCSPGWVARQIESRDTTSDLYVIRTGMAGYTDLLQKGFCADLNDLESLFPRLLSMTPAILDAISYQEHLYAVPEMVILQSHSCLLCDPTHPLWSRYHLEDHHSVSDILDMMQDLEEKDELDEWWFWNDHADAGHLYNLCVVGSASYMETEESEISLEKDEYRELFSRFDQIRQSLLNRIDPPSAKDPLFYAVSYVDESLLSNENLTPVLVTPLSGQREILQLGLQVLVMNPYAPHREEAIQYLNDLMDAYSPLQSLYLYPENAEPMKDPYAELTGRPWILSPGLISWYQKSSEQIQVPLKGLMSLFWDNQGLEMEKRYLNNSITIDQYISYLDGKLTMLKMETE